MQFCCIWHFWLEMTLRLWYWNENLKQWISLYIAIRLHSKPNRTERRTCNVTGKERETGQLRWYSEQTTELIFDHRRDINGHLLSWLSPGHQWGPSSLLLSEYCGVIPFLRNSGTAGLSRPVLSALGSYIRGGEAEFA